MEEGGGLEPPQRLITPLQFSKLPPYHLDYPSTFTLQQIKTSDPRREGTSYLFQLRSTQPHEYKLKSLVYPSRRRGTFFVPPGGRIFVPPNVDLIFITETSITKLSKMMSMIF